MAHRAGQPGAGIDVEKKEIGGEINLRKKPNLNEGTGRAGLRGDCISECADNAIMLGGHASRVYTKLRRDIYPSSPRS